jgi:hypothetical protein
VAPTYQQAAKSTIIVDEVERGTYDQLQGDDVGETTSRRTQACKRIKRLDRNGAGELGHQAESGREQAERSTPAPGNRVRGRSAALIASEQH